MGQAKDAWVKTTKHEISHSLWISLTASDKTLEHYCQMADCVGTHPFCTEKHLKTAQKASTALAMMFVCLRCTWATQWFFDSGITAAQSVPTLTKGTVMFYHDRRHPPSMGLSGSSKVMGTYKDVQFSFWDQARGKQEITAMIWLKPPLQGRSAESLGIWYSISNFIYWPHLNLDFLPEEASSSILSS